MNPSLCLGVAVGAFGLCLLQAQAALNCSIARQGNQAVISWPSESGKTYALSRSDQPTGNWRVISMNTAVVNKPSSVTVAVEGQAAFFRLIEAPPNPDPEYLVWIPPGTFTMGSPDGEEGRMDWEGPQTLVTLTKGFWMGKYEVTQGEYEAVIGSNPSGFSGDPSRPVERVSWVDATNYCAQLTQQERAAGRISVNSVYRLPTEAEWEHACRAGTTTRFSHGDDPGYTDLGNYAWYHDNSGETTHTVGEKLPNPWGLYDIHGNVWEWCQDWFAYQLPGGIAVDPQGPASGSLRVMRGGNWFWGAADSRSACRRVGEPSIADIGFGFRVVLAAVDTSEPPNPDPSKLVWIPPGTFTMGSPEDEVGRELSEGPQTTVTLTRGFWMGKYEVSQGDYENLVGINPSWFNGDRTGEGYIDYGLELNRPVEQVTWSDAVDYCGTLTTRETGAGRIPAGYTYRLPTEGEWEYACRAGTSTRFSCGDELETNYGWYGDNSEGQTHPVGQKLANPWGLYDMHGNVWEWCKDGWSSSLSGGAVTDPQGSATSSLRVIRGGDCLDAAVASRSASRFGLLPTSVSQNFGFRVVLAPGQP